MKFLTSFLFFCLVSTSIYSTVSQEEFNKRKEKNSDKKLYEAVVHQDISMITAYINDGLRFTYSDVKGLDALQLAAAFQDQRILKYLACFASLEELSKSLGEAKAIFLLRDIQATRKKIDEKKINEWSEPYFD